MRFFIGFTGTYIAGFLSEGFGDGFSDVDTVIVIARYQVDLHSSMSRIDKCATSRRKNTYDTELTIFQSPDNIQISITKLQFIQLPSSTYPNTKHQKLKSVPISMSRNAYSPDFPMTF